MDPIRKLIRADGARKTRFHTSNGRLCLHVADMFFALATTAQRRLFGRLVAMPWIALPAYRFLKRRVKGRSVFEFSSGMSTLWFAKHCREVHSVEDDPAWFARIRARTAGSPNVHLRLARSKEDYIHSIDSFPDAHFDIICIDGSHRPECFAAAVRHLRPGGLLVIDNTDVPQNRPVVNRLTESFSEKNIHRFAGYPPGNFHPTETIVCTSDGEQRRRPPRAEIVD